MIIFLLVIIVILLLPFGWLLLVAVASIVLKAMLWIFSLLGYLLGGIILALLVAALCFLGYYLWTLWASRGRIKRDKTDSQPRMDAVISASLSKHEITVTLAPTVPPNLTRLNNVVSSSNHSSLRVESHMVEDSGLIETSKPTTTNSEQV